MIGQAPLSGHLRVGAALGGHEVEGGYNAPGLPADNWCWWEVEGRVPRRPATGGFWQRWDGELAAAAAAGCDAARVSIEWARCEPLDGHPDARAMDGYCRLLDACHEHGLQPVVTLHRFAHPAWMGVDFWLRPDSPDRFARWVEVAVDRFAGRSHRWVTVDQLNACAISAYLAGRTPPGRRLDVAATVRSLDHLLTAHVLAYQTIKERQPQAVVSTGNRALPVYELDRLLVDVLLGRSSGVERHDLRPWLAERRDRFHARAPGGANALAWVLRQWARSAVPLEQALARAVAAVYDGPCPRPLDVLHVAVHGAGLADVVPLPFPKAARDDRPALADVCRAHDDLGVPLSIVCDQPSGAAELRENLEAVEAAVAAGAPVVAYHHRLPPRQCHRAPGVDLHRQPDATDAPLTLQR